MKNAYRVVLIGLAVLGVVYAGTRPEKMTREEKNKAVVRRAIEAENRGEWELWKKLVAEEYVLHTPEKTKPKKRDDVEVDARMARREFPDGRCEVEDIIGEGDRVAVRLRFVAPGVKEQHGVFGESKELVLTEIDILRLAEGKIVEEWAEYDTGSLLRKGLRMWWSSWRR